MSLLPETKEQRLRASRGQAALEYMIVIGIALLVAAPFITEAQGSVSEIRTSVGVIQAEDALNDLSSAIRTVDAAGEPAARTIRIRLPENLKSAEVSNRSIVLAVSTDTGTRKLVRRFEGNITGSLPDRGGLYFIRTRAQSSSVEVKVVS